MLNCLQLITLVKIYLKQLLISMGVKKRPQNLPCFDPQKRKYLTHCFCNLSLHLALCKHGGQ